MRCVHLSVLSFPPRSKFPKSKLMFSLMRRLIERDVFCEYHCTVSEKLNTRAISSVLKESFRREQCLKSVRMEVEKLSAFSSAQKHVFRPSWQALLDWWTQVESTSLINFTAPSLALTVVRLSSNTTATDGRARRWGVVPPRGRAGRCRDRRSTSRGRTTTRPGRSMPAPQRLTRTSPF